MENTKKSQEIQETQNTSLAPSLDMTPEVYAERVRIQLLQHSEIAINALVDAMTSTKIEVRRQAAKDYFAITGIQAQKTSINDASLNAVKEIAATTIKSTLETLGQMFENSSPIIVNEVTENKIAPKKSNPTKVSETLSDNDLLELLNDE